MRPVSETFLQTIRRSHRRATRVSALDSNFEPIAGATLTGDMGYAIGGTVTIDRRRAIRRTIELTVANPEGIWTPATSTDFFFFGNALKVERGVYLDEDTIEYVSLGIFLVDTPTVDVSSAGSTLQILGQDRMRRAANSKFAAPTTYAASTPIATVIADMADDAGMGTVLLRLDDGGKTLAVGRTYDEQEERVKAMRDLARDYSLDVYVDGDGYLVLEPIVDVTQAAIAWRFERGDDAILTGITKGFSDQRFYNHVIVSGESADHDPVRGEAADTNPLSPGYIYGPQGDRAYFYTSALITSTGQAQDVADALLPDVALIEEEIRLPHVPNPALEAGDAVEIVEPITRTDDRYLIDSITIPLGGGTSVLQTKKVRALA